MPDLLVHMKSTFHASPDCNFMKNPLLACPQERYDLNQNLKSLSAIHIKCLYQYTSMYSTFQSIYFRSIGIPK